MIGDISHPGMPPCTLWHFAAHGRVQAVWNATTGLCGKAYTELALAKEI